MAKRLMVLATMLTAMLVAAVPAFAQEVSVTGVLEEQDTKADGTTVYGMVDEATGEGYYVEAATGEDLGDLVGQRVVAYGAVRNDNGRVLTANRIELPDAPQPGQPAVGDEFSGFGVIQPLGGGMPGYGLYTGSGPGSGIYLEGDADFAAFEGENVYVSGTITNDTPVTLTVEVIEPAQEGGGEVAVTGTVFEDDDFSDGTLYNVRDEGSGEVYPLTGGPGLDLTPYLDQRATVYGTFVDEEPNGNTGTYLSVSRVELAQGAAGGQYGTTMGGGTTMMGGETTAVAGIEDGGTPEQVGIDLNEDGAVDENDGQFAVQTSDEGLASTPEEGALPGTGGLILPVVGVAGAAVLLGGLLYYRKLAS